MKLRLLNQRKKRHNSLLEMMSFNQLAKIVAQMKKLKQNYRWIHVLIEKNKMSNKLSMYVM